MAKPMALVDYSDDESDDDMDTENFAIEIARTDETPRSTTYASTTPSDQIFGVAVYAHSFIKGSTIGLYVFPLPSYRSKYGYRTRP